jgi:hypothetical protein
MIEDAINSYGEPTPEMWPASGTIIQTAGIETEAGQVIQTEDGQNIEAD